MIPSPKLNIGIKPLLFHKALQNFVPNTTQLRVTQLSAEAWVSSPPSSKLLLTQVTAEAWVSSPTSSSVLITQATIEAWITSPATQIQQWNPHFPDKPGKGGGGSGPPGKTGGGGGNPPVKIDGAYGDVVIDFDAVEFYYPAYLVSSTGAVWFVKPIVATALFGNCKIQSWAQSGIALSLSARADGTSVFTGRAAPTQAFRASGNQLSVSTGQLGPGLTAVMAGRSTSSNSGKTGYLLGLLVAGSSLIASSGSVSFLKLASLAARAFNASMGSIAPSLSASVSGLASSATSGRIGSAFSALVAGSSLAASSAMGTITRQAVLMANAFSASMGSFTPSNLTASIAGRAQAISSAASRLVLYPVLKAVPGWIVKTFVSYVTNSAGLASYIGKLLTPMFYITLYTKFVSYIVKDKSKGL